MDTFDKEEKGRLLTDFYTNLFRATEKQADLPKWVDLNKQLSRHELDGLPRIDGSLLKKAINLFKNNKSCASDKIVAEMLCVLDEDILESLAEAFSKRVLNVEGEYIWKAPRESRRVQRCPYDHGPDKLDDFRRHGRRADVCEAAPDPTCRIGVSDRSDACPRGVERYGVEANGEDMKSRRVEVVQSVTGGSQVSVSGAGPRDAAPVPTCRIGVTVRVGPALLLCASSKAEHW